MFIPLTRGLSAAVDDADYEHLAKFTWYAAPRSRPAGKFNAKRTSYEGGKKQNIYMHRVIMNAGEGIQVDHIDGNPLNNTRENLRICKQSQNNANAAYPVSSSGYRGVYQDKKRWRARIWVNKRGLSLGVYNSKEEAAAAYDAAARRHFGAFATVNFLEDK